MEVKEIVQLEDGREVTVNLTEEEHTYLLSVGINQAIVAGILALGQVDGDEVIAAPAPDKREVN